MLECKRMNININTPDINLSNTDFSIIDDNTIQYGLSAIKNIGQKASDNIVQSDRIANADINYIGAGDTARSGRKGWYTKMLETITPL